MLEVDFSDIKGGKLVEGNYIGIITGVNKTIDEKQGKVLVSFSVNINGKTRRSKLYRLEGKALFYLHQALENLGIEVPQDRVNLDSIPLVGTKAEWTVVEREWNGKKYSDLVPVRPLGRATEEEMEDLNKAGAF